MSFGRYWDGAIRDCAGMRGMSPRFYSSAFRSLSSDVSVCGAPPRAPIAPMWRPHPLFSFSRKRKEGGEKKKPGQQTHGKRTHRIFLSYLLRIALAPKGAIVRIYAYLTGKRVLFPRYERADARSILERSPKLYNQVWSPCLRTASPINRASSPHCGRAMLAPTR